MGMMGGVLLRMSGLTEWFLALAGAWCMLLLGRVLETRKVPVRVRSARPTRADVGFGVGGSVQGCCRNIPKEEDTLPGTLTGGNL
jgi:hypothetical protein